MKPGKVIKLIPLAILMTLAACAGGGDFVSSKVKGDAAFEKSDWAGAIEHYRIYLETEMGGANVWEAQFLMARSYYESEDYPSAALEFEIFRRNYPRSDSLEAAAYYEALCWFHQSPRFDRDSTPTLQAIRKLDDYLLDFPDGSHEAEAILKLGVLTDKLARKSLSIAQFYYRVGRLEAAALYYEKVLREQAQSQYVGEVLGDLEMLRREQGRDSEADELARSRQYWSPPAGSP
jgi:outer membrane protein assembly factor BamD